MSILARLFSADKDASATPKSFAIDALRQHIIGADTLIDTPYGKRLLTYADYTASGRGLTFIEDYIKDIQCLYANTHTEDDTTGRTMSALFHQAEAIIKKSVGATESDCIITCGDGATAAIYRLQQILGVAIPPTTKNRIHEQISAAVCEADYRAITKQLERYSPVVFVGPFEHHSNEVSWRSSLATVVAIELDDEGNIDLAQLEDYLQKDEYKNRLRIGSFSAASNVTGIKSPVHEIACLLHKYDAIACFDYAASGPYVEIDMNPSGYGPGEDPSLDAVFISPHKFLGGPGSSGLLLFKKTLYSQNLPPSICGGGTVSYVNKKEEDFFDEIELRERAGTPGILQTIRAALAFAVKDSLGAKAIEKREGAQVQKAFKRWALNKNIDILGNQDLKKRTGIVSFNIRSSAGNMHSQDGAYLHPKFVTRLLDDLFGLQTRAGCACAGPYGHRLLGIDKNKSDKYRSMISKGVNGIKPGWCRLGFHYSMDDAETDMIIRAVEFIAEHGDTFVSQYDFNITSGSWSHKQARPISREVSLGAALGRKTLAGKPLSTAKRVALYEAYFKDALDIAKGLQKGKTRLDAKLDGEMGKQQFFVISRETVVRQTPQ